MDYLCLSQAEIGENAAASSCVMFSHCILQRINGNGSSGGRNKGSAVAVVLLCFEHKQKEALTEHEERERAF